MLFLNYSQNSFLYRKRHSDALFFMKICTDAPPSGKSRRKGYLHIHMRRLFIFAFAVLVLIKFFHFL